MFELIVKGHFAAAHYLKGYEGKCKDLHGHTWKVDVVLTGEALNGIGMVLDFAKLKNDLRELLKTLDHINLNDIPPFDKINPTTENLARYIYENFSSYDKEVKVQRVTVWESDRAGVTYYQS